MAGGINLPTGGIGHGPVMGAMQFPAMAQDPFTTMLKAYAIGQQGRGQGIVNAAGAMELPYVADKARLGIDKLQAEIANLPAEMDYKRALTQRIGLENANPLLGSSGIAGQIAAYNQAVQMGDPNAGLILENLKRDATGQTTNAQTWRSLPMDIKAEVIGVARGLGIDPVEAATKLSQGVTLEALATEKGIDPSELYANNPVYSPTGAMRTQIQKREAAEAELDELGTFVVNSVEPYVSLGSINGYSPKMLMAQLSGTDEDAQAKFLAAYSLYPELNFIRLKLAQGEGGITALQHMEERALGNIKPFESLINQKVWGKAQRLMNEELKRAAGAYTDVAKNPGKYGNKKLVESMSGMTSNPSQMSDEELDAAIKAAGGY